MSSSAARWSGCPSRRSVAGSPLAGNVAEAIALGPAGAPAELRCDRAAAADADPRSLRGGDRRADPVVRRDARRARSLLPGAGSIRRVRPPPDRGVREPRVCRPAQCRGVRGEHAAGAGRARLLPDRVRAQRAALGRGDARRGRPGGGRGARRRLAPPCSAADGDDLRLAGAHGLDRGLTGYLRSRGRGADRGRAGREGARLAPARRRRPLRRGARPTPPSEADRCARCSRSRSSSRPATELGLVLVFFREETVFDDDQLELAGHVAGAARGALERSELYERERRARSVAQRLARAGRRARRRARSRTTCSTSPPAPRSSSSRPTRRLDPLARGRRGRRARGHRRRGARARRRPHAPRPPGSSATSCRRGRPARSPTCGDDPRSRDADPMLAAGVRGVPRRPDDRPGRLGARDPRRLRREPRRLARRRRKRRCTRSRRRPRARA